MKEKLSITRISADRQETLPDDVPREISLIIYHNGDHLVTLMCSPDSLRELAVGFLYSSCLINSAEEVKELLIDDKHLSIFVKTQDRGNTGEKIYTSGCGKGIMLSDLSEEILGKRIEAGLKVSRSQIFQMQSEFQRKSVLFRETGGVHSAALANGKTIRIFMADIGRHNAIDKVIGKALLGDLNLEDSIMLTSGRISSEIVLKVARCGTPILVSRSAPTNRAVEMARQANLTLIGFARGSRMNIYSGEERIS